MRRKTWLVVVALSALGLSSIGAYEAAAQSRRSHDADPTVAKLVQAVARSSPLEWKIRWDAKTAMPHTIYGSRSTPLDLRDRDIASAARGFMLEHAGLFRIRPELDDYRVARRGSMSGMTFIRLQQLYRGVPVYKRDYTITLDGEGCIRMIAGRSQPALDLDVKPSLSSRAASDAARDAVGPGARATETQLVIQPDEDRPRLAYHVTVAGGTAHESWEILIDASTGEVLERLSRLLHVDGLGNAFDQDPRDQLQQVTLPRLNSPGNKLAGSLVQVRNASGADATSSSSDFRYDSADSLNFAQAHAYYHIDRYLNYLTTLGYEPLDTAVAVVNIPGPLPASAWYDGLLNFSRSKVSWDAQIFYHETQHLVTAELGFTPHSGEAQSLHEGISEYAQGSMSEDPTVHPWLLTTTCPDPSYHLRSVDNDPIHFRYSNYNNLLACGLPQAGPHANGLIIAGALWDVRQSSGVGKEIADRLVLHALPMMPFDPTFGCFWDGIFVADQILYNGDHMFPIIQAKADRYLQCKPDVQLNGPSTMFVNQTASYYADSGPDECGIAGWHCFDYYRRPSGGAWTLLSECNPHPIELTESGATQFDLRVIATDGFSGRDTADRHVNVYYPLTVAISPPSSVVCDGNWTAIASGHRPFTYRWKIGTTTIGTDSTAHAFCPVSPGSFTLKLEVTDADGQMVSASRVVQCTGQGCIDPEPAAVMHPPVTVKGERAVLLVRTAEPADVKLDIYDVTGRRVASPFHGRLEPGDREISWSTRGLHNGLYFYRLSMGAEVQVDKFQILR